MVQQALQGPRAQNRMEQQALLGQRVLGALWEPRGPRARWVRRGHRR